MDFKTMSRQRRFILLASAIGIIAMFLPWIDVLFVNVNGMHGRGIFVFLCFVGSAIISYIGNQSQNLDKTMWMLTLILGGIASLIMIFTFFDGNAIINVFSYGFYIAFLAVIGVVLSAWIFKTPGDNIKDGIDSLKKDIEDKTKSPPIL